MSLKVALIGVAVVALSGIAIVQHIAESTKDQEIRPPNADERAELRRLGRIAVTRDYGLDSAIVTMRWDGSGVRRLGRGQDPSWSPGSRRIAFTRFGDEHVFGMRASGEGVHRLARGTSPDWSPDGSSIAFARTEGRVGRERNAVWIMRSDGSGQRRLWPGANPSWSPDGRRIAFERGGLLHGETLWVGEPGGAPSRKLADAWDPAWSPDGEWILVSTDQEEEGLFTQPSELALVDPDSGDLHRLGGKRGLFGTGPSTTGGTWSSDGEWFAFSCSSTQLCVTRSDWKHDWLGIAGMQIGESPLPNGQP